MQISENIFCSIFPFITIFSFFRLDNFLWHDIHCCFPLSFPCFYLVHPVSSFHLPYILYVIFPFDSPLYLQITYWDFSFFVQEQAQDLITTVGLTFSCFPLCNVPSILGFSWAPLLSSLLRELGFNHLLSGTLQWPCSHLWSSATITQRANVTEVFPTTSQKGRFLFLGVLDLVVSCCDICDFSIWWFLKGHFQALWAQQEGFPGFFLCIEAFTFVFYAV